MKVRRASGVAPHSTSLDGYIDPDLRLDVLPQPYRRIHSVLESILNATWDRIQEAELQRKQQYERDMVCTRPRVALVGGCRLCVEACFSLHRRQCHPLLMYWVGGGFTLSFGH